MKLFNHLTEDQRSKAVHSCMHQIVDDMLEGVIQIEAHDEEDQKAKKDLEDAIEEAKNLPEAEQTHFLMNKEDVSSYILALAIDLAKSTFYHSDDENVINIDELDEEFDDADPDSSEDIDVSDEELGIINTANNNKKHSIN